MSLCFSRLLAIFLTLYFTTHLSWLDWLYFYSFFILEYFDLVLEHFAACYVPLIGKLPCSAPMENLASIRLIQDFGRRGVPGIYQVLKGGTFTRPRVCVNTVMLCLDVPPIIHSIF